jgi:hypothetical protein
MSEQGSGELWISEVALSGSIGDWKLGDARAGARLALRQRRRFSAPMATKKPSGWQSRGKACFESARSLVGSTGHSKPRDARVGAGLALRERTCFWCGATPDPEPGRCKGRGQDCFEAAKSLFVANGDQQPGSCQSRVQAWLESAKLLVGATGYEKPRDAMAGARLVVRERTCFWSYAPPDPEPGRCQGRGKACSEAAKSPLGSNGDQKPGGCQSRGQAWLESAKWLVGDSGHEKPRDARAGAKLVVTERTCFWWCATSDPEPGRCQGRG